MTKLFVCKFGGTSVASAKGREAIVSQIKNHIDAGHACVLVVSAMGRAGDPYATDTLLGLVDGHPTDAEELDALASVGEIISSVVVAHELRAAGIKAKALSGAMAGIYASGSAQAGVVSKIHTHKIKEVIERGAVPVVCGFQAVGENGEIITLGRGGSDTSACALGVALKAEAVEIYSDVDGVLTADPRIVKDAQSIKVIRSDELFQLAKMGSRIIHAPAAELALNAHISLYLKNTYSDFEGTKVVDVEAYRPTALATAITHTRDISRFVVNLKSQEGSAKHLKLQSDIYNKLASCCISLDMFSPARDMLLFTVAGDQTQNTINCLSGITTDFECDESLAKVTIVGAGMHGVPGVMARIARHLVPENIDIFQTADSHNTISVLVRDKQAKRAVEVLHRAFNLDGKGEEEAQGVAGSCEINIEEK